MIELGKINSLKVVRKSDLGFMLSDGMDDVLLHFSQSKKEHQINEIVDVFIYADKMKRKTATEQDVVATIEKAGFANVVSVEENGVFVSINTPKDVYVSKDNLPYDKKKWPQVDDVLFIRLKEQRDTLVGKPLNRFDIKALHKNVKYADGEMTSGYVCRLGDNGINIVSKDMMHIFVPQTQLRGMYRLGQEVSVKITKAVNDESEYYGTLNAVKEELVDTDCEIILNYMKMNNGSLKLTAKSSSEEVEALLHMSRKAFKRAYGALYKERIIDFKDDITFIVKKDGE